MKKTIREVDVVVEANEGRILTHVVGSAEEFIYDPTHYGLRLAAISTAKRTTGRTATGVRLVGAQLTAGGLSPCYRITLA
jgi:hypothetical protein